MMRYWQILRQGMQVAEANLNQYYFFPFPDSPDSKKIATPLEVLATGD